MRYRCRCLVIHAPTDLRLDEQDAGEIGPGQVLVRVGFGGICGSDLHYFHHGGFGTVRIQQPMVLGHEVAGSVAAVADDVTSVKVGDRVAVNPSRPCGACKYCLEGLPHQCLDMRFYGSAMRMPHIQGAFRDALVCNASQCHIVADGIPLQQAALAEPFSVGLHGVSRAGPLLGKRVLVSGCGPIGALALVAARVHGAAEIVVTDVVDEPLGGDVSIPLNMVVAKELAILGSFRFHAEFALALQLINQRRMDLAPLITRAFPMAQAREAFELASDRKQAMKVLIDFAPVG